MSHHPRLLCFAFWSAGILSCFSTTYYVSPTGADTTSGGTSTAPWKTVAYAASKIPAEQGHTLQMAAGTYLESTSIQLPRGVNLKGAGVTKTILKGSFTSGSLLKLTNPSVPALGNQTIEGFAIDGQSRSLASGIYVCNVHNVTIQNFEVRDVRDGGLTVFAGWAPTKTTPPATYITGIKIQNGVLKNGGHDYLDQGYSTGPLQIGGLDGAEISNLVIEENEGYGIKFTAFGWLKRTKIHDCKITVPYDDVSWGTDAAIELWNLSDGCEIYNNTINTWISLCMGGKGASTKSVKIYNNVVNRATKPGLGLELSVPDSEVFDNYFVESSVANYLAGVTNLSIHHNIFKSANQLSHGFQIYYEVPGRVGEVQLYHNVFDGVKYAAYLQVKTTAGNTIENVSLRNNIFMNVQSAISCSGPLSNIKGTVLSGNQFYQCASLLPTGLEVAQSDNNTGNPGLALSGATIDDYYRPTSASSPVVDVARSVGLDFEGAAPDCGAIDFGGSAPLVHDTWSDGSFTDGTELRDVAWKNTPGTMSVIPDSTLDETGGGVLSLKTGGTNLDAYLIATIPTVTLAVGQGVRASFLVRLSGTPSLDNTRTGFGFSNKSNVWTPGTDGRAYFVRTSLGQNSTKLSFIVKDKGTQLINPNTGDPNLGATFSSVNLGTSVHEVQFELFRSGTSTMEIRYRLDHGPIVTRTDTACSATTDTTFTNFILRYRSSLNATQEDFRIDNFSVVRVTKPLL